MLRTLENSPPFFRCLSIAVLSPTVTVSTPPTVTISSPTDGSSTTFTQTVLLSGIVQDAEDADDSLAVEWTSDHDGSIGSPTPDSSGAVALLTATLNIGSHLLTLSATDSAGLTGTATVSVSVSNN